MGDKERYPDNYFSCRKISPDLYSDYKIPAYLKRILPTDLSSPILDIGCGFGQLLRELKRYGFVHAEGVDISIEAVDFCKSQNFTVDLIHDLGDYCNKAVRKYSFIIMNHVLEHIEKKSMVPLLRLIRENLLAQDGSLVIMVPNAQSNTGCYWAYEDFTHTTLFTAGSLYYVLKAAGFREVEFLDVECTYGSGFAKKMIRSFLLKIYRTKINFWNSITCSAYHSPSPQIFSYEIKAFARK